MRSSGRYFDYARKNFASLAGRRIILTGGTGGIGQAMAKLLASIGCPLLLLVRNERLGEELAQTLRKDYGAAVTLFHYDGLDPEAAAKVLAHLEEEEPFDFLFSNAGIYHQPPLCLGGIERTFLVNCLAPLDLIDRLHAAYPKMKIVQTLSLTYSTKPRFREGDLADGASFLRYLGSIESRNRRYGLSKRFLMQALLVRQNEGADITLAHPGVVCTNLFDPKNKAYPKWFYKIVPPLMRIVFMSAEKAALSILKAGNDEVAEGKFVGPRGLFHAWGYPTAYAYRKSVQSHEEEVASLLREIAQR